MTAEPRTESPSHFRALVEELERNVGVLAEAVGNNTERITEVERKLEHHVSAELARVSMELARVSTARSRVVAHLSVQ